MLARPSAPLPPRAAPLALYRGAVSHARLSPKRHRFSYSMTAIAIDLDRLDEADRSARIFSVNKPNITAFHERDHGPRDGKPLRPWVDGLLARAGVARPASVTLLCYPSVFGYEFNPLAVYFCRDFLGALTALVYQVHNTFGESHCYVEPVRPRDRTKRGIVQRRAKRFYVSPFMDMDLEYRFTIRPPGDDVLLDVREFGGAEMVFAAAFRGERIEAGDSALLGAILQTFAITWKVTAAIHFEALRLWLKGLKIRPRPAPPEPASFPEWQLDSRPMPGQARTAPEQQ